MVTVSAPGKIFLMGEHAVVYGYPALLSAINLRLKVTITPKADRGITIYSEDSPQYILYAIEKTQEHFHIKSMPDFSIHVDSDIPSGFHIGSSAAVAVATVGAVAYFCKKIWNPAACNRVAYEIEKKQHGNPSGADNTAITVGGLLWYRKEFEFLKSMWQLPYTLPLRMNHFYLINSGKPKESTRDMVQAVAKRVKKNAEKMQKIFSTNEKQVRRIAVALKEGDQDELVDAMQLGEKTLEDMGVVGKKVIPIIREIEKAKGAAKILGGGGVKDGVGFLLCYHTDKKYIADLCKEYAYTITDITLGEGGVRLDEK